MGSRAIGRSSKTKRERRQKLLWLTEAQAALGWGVLLALAAVLGAIYLHQTSGIARVGRTVQSLQRELNELKRVNAGIELDIAEAQAIDRLQGEAKRLGFVPASLEDIEYKVIEDYPPDEIADESFQPDPEPAAAETILEAIFRAFSSRITDFTRGEAS